MLNTFGVASMQKILLKIHEEFSDLEYCPILPRVIQFFLWYVPEKVALKMVTLLIKKDISAEANLKVEEGNTVKFFSTSIISMKKLVKQGIPICKDVEEREKAKKIISELITEMFVNVLEVGVRNI